MQVEVFMSFPKHVNFPLTNVKVIKKLSWHLCSALSICPKRLTTLCGGLCQWDCLLYVNYHIAFITHLLQPELLFLHLNGCRICVHLSLLENCLSLLSPNVAECVKCKFSFILFVYIEDITCPRVDMNFIFELSTRYLTSERSERVRYRVDHEKIKFISISGHVIFCLLYKHQWNTKWAFPRKLHIFTREDNIMWRDHRRYGYIINRAFA